MILVMQHIALGIEPLTLELRATRICAADVSK
jgi:hypothetical protein